MVKNLPFNAGDSSSIPCAGTEISHVAHDPVKSPHAATKT